MTDLQYAWRQIRNAPAFAGVVIGLMAIGIAANATIFTLVDTLLLRKLPVRSPEELVRIVDHHPPIPDSSYFNYGYWKFLRAHSTSFSEVIGQAEFTTGITVDGVTDFVNVGLVTENYFAVLGVKPALGGWLAGIDTVVLSHRYWRSKFNADPGVVGRAIQLNSHPFTVVGVTAADFHGTTIELNPDVRVPAKAALQMIDLPPGPHDEGFFPYELVARLKPGVSLDRALSESMSLYESSSDEYARTHPEVTREGLKLNGQMLIRPIEHGVSVLRDQFASALTLLMAGVGLVLLMACSNVAGLLLERATARERETAVRLAVGASQGRLMRQWLTESLLLTGFGGLLGVAFAELAMPVLAAMIPPLRNRAGELLEIDPHFGLNWRVLLFSFAACLVAAVVAGFAPAWRAGKYDLSQSLRSSRSSSHVEGGITVFQVALCTLLLIEAGLFVRTLSAMRTKDLGFDRDHIAAFTLRAEHAGTEAFREPLLAEVRQLPGVRAAAYARAGLLRGFGIKTTVGLPGQQVPPSAFMNTSMNSVSPDYFDTMGVRVAAGRRLEKADVTKSGVTPVVVNQAFALQFFAREDPIGKLFGTGAPGTVVTPTQQVVGVVTDSQYRSLRELVPPTIYSLDWGEPNILHARAAGDPATLIAPVRELVRKLAPGWRVREVNLLCDEAERSIWRERLVAQLAIALAGVAALLAAIGLYGTLSYYVSRNRRGIGIRVAIGAARADVLALLASRVSRLIGSGGALGLMGAFALSRWVRTLLFGVAPADPVSMGLGVALLMVIALVALVAPAWRASRIDPAVALRED